MNFRFFIFLLCFCHKGICQITNPAPAIGWEKFNEELISAQPKIDSQLSMVGLIIFNYSAEVTRRGKLLWIKTEDSGSLNGDCTDSIIAVLQRTIWKAGTKKGKRKTMIFSQTFFLKKNTSHLAQPLNEKDSTPSWQPERVAKFPGGHIAMMDLIMKEFRCPPECEGVHFSYTKLQFWVDTFGGLSHFTVMEGPASCPHYPLELIRILKTGGKWIPAIHQGRYIGSFVELPITICLE